MPHGLQAGVECFKSLSRSLCLLLHLEVRRYTSTVDAIMRRCRWCGLSASSFPTVDLPLDVSQRRENPLK